MLYSAWATCHPPVQHSMTRSNFEIWLAGWIQSMMAFGFFLSKCIDLYVVTQSSTTIPCILCEPTDGLEELFLPTTIVITLKHYLIGRDSDYPLGYFGRCCDYFCSCFGDSDHADIAWSALTGRRFGFAFHTLVWGPNCCGSCLRRSWRCPGPCCSILEHASRFAHFGSFWSLVWY